MSMYFVTGASGVVGSALVPVLLRETEAAIHLLLRPLPGQSLEARMRGLEEFWLRHYPDLSAQMLRQRVRPVAGEITEPGLGLAADEQAILRAECTHLIHCAASVRMNQPLEEARRTALYPVQSVLELGTRCARLVKAEFVSTVGVGGRWHGPLPERWLHTPRQFHNTYEAAKAEAETLVHTAVAQGFPATIHRPSMVVGDSNTGAVIHFQIFYFLCDFLSGRRTLGLYPSLGRSVLDIVPNDYVARGIVAASRDLETRGRLLHLCAGPDRALRLDALRTTIRTLYRAAGRIGWLPILDLAPANFARLMRGVALMLPSRQRRAIRTLPLFLDYLAGEQQFGNGETLAMMARWGIPRADPAAVATSALRYYLAAG